MRTLSLIAVWASVSTVAPAHAEFLWAGHQYTCQDTAAAGLTFNKMAGVWQPQAFKPEQYTLRETTSEERAKPYSQARGDWGLYDLSDPTFDYVLGSCSIIKLHAYEKEDHISCQSSAPTLDVTLSTDGRFALIRPGALPNATGGDDAIIETGYCQLK
ncbi:hypothetical protein [Rhodopila sp.]|uniref:hypothetical protein n=1 Tax=Rhodopila sp. TaxID=2480087 RepID=UPI003D10EB79